MLCDADMSHTANATETPAVSKQASIYALLSPESSLEQKFVGLYLIPKILSPEDEHAMQQLKKHMPWSFLGQLLKQDAIMDDGMTGPFQDPVYVVALHVLEALSLLELYFKDPRYVELVTHLGPYLEMGEIDAKSIALSILLPQTTFTEGREALAKSGLLLQASALVKESPSEEIQGKALDVLKYWTMSLSDDSLAPQEKPFVVATQNLDQDLGVIENLSEAFRTAQSAFKFDVAQAAIAWMSETSQIVTETSLANFKSGLVSILSSKISDAHRDVALVLTDLLVTLQGNSFIRASVVSDSNIPPISHAQWISLILHLAGAELRVLLDAYSSKRDSLRESRMIPVTCHLLEQTLACLFDESLYVQPNVILPLRDTLRDLFVSATDFLFDQFEQYELSGNPDLVDNPVFLLVFKALLFWTVEECVPTQELINLLPMVLYILSLRRSLCLGIFPFSLIESFLSLVVQTPELLEAFQQRGGAMLVLNILDKGSMSADEEEQVLGWVDQLLEVASLSLPEQRVYDRWLSRCIR